jgi:hypothetical protein
MATLREESAWTSPIYRIERSDPLMGGEYGVSNTQARQLANRTRYLLDRLLAEHALDGSHSLSERMVSATAAIAESKLRLDCPTSHLYQQIQDARAVLQGLLSALDSVRNLEDSTFRSIYEALLLSWKYGYPRFAFDMFTDNFSLRGKFRDTPLLETVSGDDSIDVADSAAIVPGESYVLWDRDASVSTPVTVKKVLSAHRVILYEEEPKTRANTGVLAKMSWEIHDGIALAVPGSMLITAQISLLDGFDKGNLLIGHYDPCAFSVEVRSADASDPTAWQELPLISNVYSERLRLWRSVYETPGGTLYFRITARNDARIAHMAFMSDTVSTLSTTVRTPVVADKDFTIVRFGAVYGATHTGTLFALAPSADFTGGYTTLSFGPNGSRAPIWDYKRQVLERYPMQVGDAVYWRAWYTASDGYRSRWSDVARYVHEV